MALLLLITVTKQHLDNVKKKKRTPVFTIEPNIRRRGRTPSSGQHNARGLIVAVDVIHQVLAGQAPVRIQQIFH